MYRTLDFSYMSAQSVDLAVAGGLRTVGLVTRLNVRGMQINDKCGKFNSYGKMTRT